MHLENQDELQQATGAAPGAERLISTEAWINLHYGEGAPTLATVYRWIRESRISPAPEKHGRQYYFFPSARYVTSASEQ